MALPVHTDSGIYMSNHPPGEKNLLAAVSFLGSRIVIKEKANNPMVGRG